MSKNKKRLQELSGSDFEVAKGQPDIRGWEVRDRTGYLLGKVKDLIFDSRAHKVRYLVVNVVDSKELQLETRTVMVPIGLAVLQPKDDDVILENITPFQLRALPRYSKEDLGTKAERAISTVFGRTDSKGGAAQTDDEELTEDFYDNDYFNENNMYRNRNTATANTTSNTSSGNTLSDAEAASLKRDADLRRTNTQADINSANDQTLPRHTNETDEEYRNRLNRNNRS
jgi:sporulation protein YlmC with PRC-barrel domain